MKNQITAENVADFYNETFFDKDDNILMSKMDLIISAGGRTLPIPNAFVDPNAPFHTVILNFHRRLKDGGPLDFSQTPGQTTDEENKKEGEKHLNINPELSDFKKIEYRNNFYWVELFEGDQFRVMNEMRSKEIDLKSPTAKAVIKKYKLESDFLPPPEK